MPVGPNAKPPLVTEPASVQWVTIEDTDAYDTVLRIRREAFVRAGKLPSKVELEDLRLADDPASRIALLYAGNTPMGTATLQPEPERCRCHQCRICVFVHDLWSSDVGSGGNVGQRAVVGRRLAVTNEFAGRGFAFRLLRGVLATAAAAQGRSAVVVGTDEPLIPVYERDGWRRTGVWYQNPGLVGVRDEVIVLDVAGWFVRNPDFRMPPERA